MAVFDGINDGLKILGSTWNFFKNELVSNGEAVHKNVADSECLEHPVLGGVVAECFGVADELLVLVVAFDVDAKHVFDGDFQSMEGSARKWPFVVKVVIYPKFLYAFEAYFIGSAYGIDKPNILFESISVSHGQIIFGAKLRKNLGCFMF